MDTENRGESPHRGNAASTYQCETGETASETVVRLVASRRDDDPIALDPPLYEAIDPDSLDALFVDTSGRWVRPSSRIEFPYCGYQVEVRGDGHVTVRDRPGHHV